MYATGKRNDNFIYLTQFRLAETESQKAKDYICKYIFFYKQNSNANNSKNNNNNSNSKKKKICIYL